MILILGKQGQLARALDRELSARENAFGMLGSDKLNLLDNLPSLETNIANLAPSAIINATGYTAVDAAESYPKEARVLNADVPAELGRICQKHDIPLVHISTDYVFNGTSNNPYKPNAPRSPINTYGQTKLEGERALQAGDGPVAILRTSWLYDGHGKNFLTAMLNLAESKTDIQVVDDQIGRPTYAGHLAEACLAMLEHIPKEPTLYHVTNSGNPISWAGFAREIFSRSGTSCNVIPIPTQDYPTPAKRPAYSVLDISGFEAVTNHTMPDWKDGLAAALKERV